jgi:hypothetical protein
MVGVPKQSSPGFAAEKCAYCDGWAFCLVAFAVFAVMARESSWFDSPLNPVRRVAVQVRWQYRTRVVIVPIVPAEVG